MLFGKKSVAGAFAMAALVTLQAGIARADTFYATTTDTSFTSGGSTSMGGGLYDIHSSLTNNGSQTLDNVYFLATVFRIGGVDADLTAPGTYDNSNGVASATNAAAYLVPSQTDATFQSGDGGSTTVPQVPAFLIASSLAPGQTATFDVDFETTDATFSVSGPAVTATSVPEPALAGAAVLAILGLTRRRFRAV